MNNLFFTFCILLISSCTQRYQPKVSQESDYMKDVFIDANRQIIYNEEKKIDSLLSFLNVPFVKDSTGIRIFIQPRSSHIKSTFPKDGSDVLVAYHCLLLDEYSTILDNNFVDTISFQIGYSKQMKGLNYAIKLLKVGDKAKIIIPSYLGFGMSGYKKTVPPYSTLLLNVKLLNIKE